MLFLKCVIVYLLLFAGYLAYIVSQNTPEHWHAASLFIGSMGSFIIAPIVAFKDHVNSSKENEESLVLEQAHDSEQD